MNVDLLWVLALLVTGGPAFGYDRIMGAGQKLCSPPAEHETKTSSVEVTGGKARQEHIKSGLHPNSAERAGGPPAKYAAQGDPSVAELGARGVGGHSGLAALHPPPASPPEALAYPPARHSVGQCAAKGRGWSADQCGAQGHDLEIVIQVLSQAAAERSAGDAWVALAVVADAPDVAVRLVGKKNVGP